jgi:soluble lytic murein transglycosylase-like protein
MKKIHNLPFSIEELDYHTHYLGMNTNGTFIYFDAVTGSVYRWNPKTGYFRRNSSKTMDGRNALVTKKKIHTMNFDMFQNYIDTYRKTISRRKTRQHRFSSPDGWVNV